MAALLAGWRFRVGDGVQRRVSRLHFAFADLEILRRCGDGLVVIHTGLDPRDIKGPRGHRPGSFSVRRGEHGDVQSGNQESSFQLQNKILDKWCRGLSVQDAMPSPIKCNGIYLTIESRCVAVIPDAPPVPATIAPPPEPAPSAAGRHTWPGDRCARRSPGRRAARGGPPAVRLSPTPS
ncbi:hypothetical protein G6F57_019060 [Rhizopus arrhizus]|nr:hypothetical protein G6F57_019060 [Rhizopus arrhizus]